MKTLTNWIKIQIKNLSYFKKRILLNKAYNEYQRRGETSKEGYMTLVRTFCKTNGILTEEKHQQLVRSNPPKKLNHNLQGAIGELNETEFMQINTNLIKNGYVVFSNRIPVELVEKIRSFALHCPTRMAPKYEEPICFDPNHIQSEIYRFDQQDLANNTDIQELIMDPTFINIARKYLECEPIFDFPAMWWSTPFLKNASEEAAQLFHFDLDRLKWLKIFIYLTDVTLENGPHQFIRGSHTPGSKPSALLKRGYARIQDEDIFKYHNKNDLRIVTGDAGTVFAEDTKCWHKGTPLILGNRLVLELQYTSSLFGANYPTLLMHNYSEKFKAFCLGNSTYASKFIFNN